MPYYYNVNQVQISTNATANTATDHLRTLTVANQGAAAFTGLFAGANGTTAGGIILRLNRYATASTVGTAATPAPKNTRSPAAQLTAFTAPTVGTTATVQIAVGLPQTGGMGGWIATDPDNWIVLQANGGANGNLDLLSIAAGTSQTLDTTVEFCELS